MDRKLVIILGLLLISGIVLSLAAYFFGVFDFDLKVAFALREENDPALNAFMTAISFLGDGWVPVVLVVAVTAFCAWKKKWVESAFMIATLSSGVQWREYSRCLSATWRTRQWLARRGARLGFADFISWHLASFDALILAQTTALALESHGLGICYIGTTLHSMRAIADFLECPPNCLPATSMVVGWPAELPPQRDGLPGRAWIHRERYQRPSGEQIDERFSEREQRGRERYLSMGPEMAARWAEHGIASLAQFYTSKIKYDPDVFAEDSAALEALMRERGFLA